MTDKGEVYEFAGMAEQANKIAHDNMMLVLESKKYNPAKTSEWTDQMGNKILEKLRDVSPYFKYVVSCVIVQKVGAGLHYESIAHWDSKTDGLLTTKFENDSLICITTIVAAAI